MIRHDIVGVRKEKVILIAPGFIDDEVLAIARDHGIVERGHNIT